MTRRPAHTGPAPTVNQSPAHDHPLYARLPPCSELPTRVCFPRVGGRLGTGQQAPEKGSAMDKARLTGFPGLLPYWFSQASFLALTPKPVLKTTRWEIPTAFVFVKGCYQPDQPKGAGVPRSPREGMCVESGLVREVQRKTSSISSLQEGEAGCSAHCGKETRDPF